MSIAMLAVIMNSIAAVIVLRSSGRADQRGDRGFSYFGGMLGILNVGLVAWNAYSLGSHQ